MRDDQFCLGFDRGPSPGIAHAVDGAFLAFGAFRPSFSHAESTGTERRCRRNRGVRALLLRLERFSINLSHVIARSAATIAVGTRIAARPPHRTVRAAFPHTAPTSGMYAKRPRPALSVGRFTYAIQGFDKLSRVTRLPGSVSGSVSVWSAFPSVPALGSAGSSPGRPASFVGFKTTMAGSDFSCPFVFGYGSSPPRCGPARREPPGRT